MRFYCHLLGLGVLSILYSLFYSQVPSPSPSRLTIYSRNYHIIIKSCLFSLLQSLVVNINVRVSRSNKEL